MKVTFKLTLAELCLMVYYAWFFLPYMRTTFTGIYKYLFFAFFAAGIGCLVVMNFLRNGTKITLKMTMLVPILLYMLVMVAMVLARAGDASGHIRVSFTFWGTALIWYLMDFDPDMRRRFGTFLLLIVLFTVATSFLGVLEDPSVARAMSNASQSKDALELDYILGRKNISSLYLFQCIAIAAPIFVYMIKKGKVLWGLIGLVFSFVAILQASFTICLMCLVLGVLFSILHSKNKLSLIIISTCCIILLLLPWSTILNALATVIDNKYITPRLQELSAMLSTGAVDGDAGLRAEAYFCSLRTFWEHPFGVGPQYAYIIGEDGIGYHSQFLDDLARFGIFAAVFYALYLGYFYKLLKAQWRKIDMADAVLPMLLVYCAFLVLNLAFRDPAESVVILFVLPVLPDIILHRRNGKLCLANASQGS